MKRFSILLLGIMLILSATATIPTSAATTLTVNCGTTLRGVTHCASGSLYGITENLPSDISGIVTPLNPYVFTNPARAGSGYQQPIGAAIPVAKRLQNVAPTAKVMIRLADIYPGWPYQFTNMTDWLNKVSSLINDKKTSGYTNFYGYELWNEPDGTWKSANGDFNSVFWPQTYNKVRSLDSGAKIIGPSYSYYNHNSMSAFLTYCKNNNCLPDIICWHELGGVQYVNNNILDYRALESTLGITPRAISINEYCDTDHNLEGQPGSSARFFAKFERRGVDSACISWWFTGAPGRLGSLMANDSGGKGAGWYFYKWYGDMAGNMVSTTAPDDNSAQMDGCACVNGNTVTVLFGGPNDGTCVINVNGLPSGIGSTANVLVQKVDWVNKDTVCNGPATISQSNYTVSSGSITVTVSGTNGSSGYRVYITPGSGGTSTPTPTPAGVTPTPTPGGGTVVSSGHTYKLVNRNSGKVLGITNMSTADGATAIQWSDSGTADHNWKITLVNGYYRLTNANSGKVLGISNMSTADGANAIQWSDSGTTDHDWTMTDTGSGVYKLVNRNSGKVLGISNMSKADGANVLQWSDNGTADHLWTLILVN